MNGRAVPGATKKGEKLSFWCGIPSNQGANFRVFDRIAASEA
jgi:hypothetical protein